MDVHDQCLNPYRTIYIRPSLQTICMSSCNYIISLKSIGVLGREPCMRVDRICGVGCKFGANSGRRSFVDFMNSRLSPPLLKANYCQS